MVDCLDMDNRVEVGDRDEVHIQNDQSRPVGRDWEYWEALPWREGLLAAY